MRTNSPIPVHIMLRYELEKKMLEGSLPVADLPEAWNENLEQSASISSPANGHRWLLAGHPLGRGPFWILSFLCARRRDRRAS